MQRHERGTCVYLYARSSHTTEPACHRCYFMELLKDIFCPDGTRTCLFGNKKKTLETVLIRTKNNTDVVVAPLFHNCTMGCTGCMETDMPQGTNPVPVNYKDFPYHLSLTVCYHAYNDMFGDLDTCRIVAGPRITDSRNLIISFTGPGEPLQNISLVREAGRTAKNARRFLGYQNVSLAVSTVMSGPGLHEITDIAIRHGLLISAGFILHSPLDEKRRKMIPAHDTSVLPVERCFLALREHDDKLKGNATTMDEYDARKTCMSDIWYCLKSGVNDSMEELTELTRLAAEYKIPVKITYDPWKNGRKMEQIGKTWQKSLQKNGICAEFYHPESINGKCPCCLPELSYWKDMVPIIQDGNGGNS